MTLNAAQGINLARGQSPVPSPRTSGGTARLPHHLLPEERMLSETQGSALGKAVPPQALKKGPCSHSAFFFFPSGLNPLLERDKSISRETGSLCSQGLSQLPLSFCHGVTQQ